MSKYQRSTITTGQLTMRAQIGKFPKVSDAEILKHMAARQYTKLPLLLQKHDVIRVAREHARNLPMPPRHMFIDNHKERRR